MKNLTENCFLIANKCITDGFYSISILQLLFAFFYVHSTAFRKFMAKFEILTPNPNSFLGGSTRKGVIFEWFPWQILPYKIKREKVFSIFIHLYKLVEWKTTDMYREKEKVLNLDLWGLLFANDCLPLLTPHSHKQQLESKKVEKLLNPLE